MTNTHDNLDQKAQEFLEKVIKDIQSSDYEHWTFGGETTGNTRVNTHDAKRVIESTLNCFCEYLKTGELPDTENGYFM